MSTTKSNNSNAVADFLTQDDIAGDPLCSELARIMTTTVGQTSAGYFYLPEPAWTRFRDWIPHAFGEGNRVIEKASKVLAIVQSPNVELSTSLRDNIKQAHSVVRQVVMTAAITAPPDAWLMRHILAALRAAGLAQKLAAGEVIDPDDCTSDDGDRLLAHELRCDLSFLLSRGMLLVTQGGFRAADHRAAQLAFSSVFVVTEPGKSDFAAAWTRVLSGSPQDDDVENLRREFDAAEELQTSEREPGRWQAMPADVRQSSRLVPLVLGLRAARKIGDIIDAGRVDDDTIGSDAHLAQQARRTFAAAGMIDDDGVLNEVGQRVLSRGPGPFGIIETYHPYLAQLSAIWRRGRTAVWVERTANVAASQDANRRSFERANDVLDRFCVDTGFSYNVFIEHALGKGEATRQRYERVQKVTTTQSGQGAATARGEMRYVGADLEDQAIDAAIEERDRGALPQEMIFVREADIGIPARLLDGLSANNVDSHGAVMVVGNGFHEVREQTDARMTEVFAGYERAGIVLLFTEETALSVDDLLQTAWNTYHAGFKYVHQRSGQGLRPAVPRPPSILEGSLPASWSQCATDAGYVRLDAYSTRSRTVYPYTPTSGHNPAISVTHFCVPKDIATRLGMLESSTTKLGST